MRILFATLLGAHALIHLIGPAKAFGWANVRQLQDSISPLGGALWLTAAMLLAGAALAYALGAAWWWWPCLPGVVLSQWLIVQAWSDAKFGTIANVVIAIPLALLALDARPSSFRSRFAHDRDVLLARSVRAASSVTDADLAPLPPLMQSYLRRTGAVGRSHVQNLRVRFQARMRSSPTAPWMDAVATQYEFFDPPARLFYMNATRSGVPFDIFHRYVDDAATFQVRIAGLLPVVDKSGPVLTRAETVTLMNDILVMAPAAVLDLPFSWKTVGERSLRATFTNAGTPSRPRSRSTRRATSSVSFRAIGRRKTPRGAAACRGPHPSRAIARSTGSVSARSATRIGSRPPASGPTASSPFNPSRTTSLNSAARLRAGASSSARCAPQRGESAASSNRAAVARARCVAEES